MHPPRDVTVQSLLRAPLANTEGEGIIKCDKFNKAGTATRKTAIERMISNETLSERELRPGLRIFESYILQQAGSTPWHDELT